MKIYILSDTNTFVLLFNVHIVIRCHRNISFFSQAQQQRLKDTYDSVNQTTVTAGVIVSEANQTVLEVEDMITVNLLFINFLHGIQYTVNYCMQI